MVLVKNPRKLDQEKVKKVETLASLGYRINKIAKCLDVTPRTLYIWLYESYLSEEREEEPSELLKELREAWSRGRKEWKNQKDQEFIELISKRMDL